MTCPGDTEPSGPPDDVVMVEAIAEDMAKLSEVALALGADLARLADRLRAQVDEARRGRP